jgi:hypothetical protein
MAALAQFPVQHADQVERFWGQNLVVPAARRGGNLNATRHRVLLRAWPRLVPGRDSRWIDTRR